MSFMKSEIRKTLIQKLNDALVAEIPGLTRTSSSKRETSFKS